MCARTVCFVICPQVVPTAEVTPPQSNGWKLTVAGILLVLLVASSVQLSLVANITKLPKVSLLTQLCGHLPLPNATTTARFRH